MGLHAGRDPQQHVGPVVPVVAHEPLEAVDLVERIDDDSTDPGRQRGPEFLQ
jgi:hypothetical protein